ncbi:MAG: hypothetical protein K8R44_04615 [Sulfurimonas sp.]|nr:hypothetical protein [Sulfurimonas sp.]
MLNISKWIKVKYGASSGNEELKYENDYFINNKGSTGVKLPCEESFNPNKPNRLLKLVLGKSYHEFPDFLQSELTTKA